jgi:transcription elongation GreA/GreB family factor
MKQALLDTCNAIIQQKIEMMIHSIEAAKESRDNEEKSSAGDKYETGRAMSQMELEKFQVQLAKFQKIKSDLESINTELEHDKVKYGSVIESSNGRFFVAGALGKIDHEGKSYYAISLASPIGQALVDKKAGESYRLQGKEIKILSIQ